MKKHITIIVLFFMTFFVQAQSFERMFFKTDTSNVYLTSRVYENDGKFYSFYTEWLDTNHSNVHYLVLDADNGNILVDSIIFCDSFPGRYYGVGKINNNYVFITTNYNGIHKEENGKIFVVDSTFHILYNGQLPLLGDSMIWGTPQVISDVEGNLIFIWKQSNDNAYSFTTHFLKTTAQLDSLNFLTLQVLADLVFDDTILHEYVITPTYCNSNDTNIILFYDYDFMLDTFVRKPNYIQDPPIGIQCSYFRLSSKKFIYSSQSYNNNRGMGVYLYGENKNLIDYKILSSTSNSVPVEIISLSKIDNEYFYFAGETNWDAVMGVYNDTNSIVLYKIDTNLQIKWKHYYFEEIFHYPYYMLTTRDKGCLIYGALYAHTGFFILKVDSLGNLQWSHGLDVVEKVALVYPNPVENVLYVDNGLGSCVRASLMLYDVNGRQVISKPLVPKMNSIDVSSLPQGVYFYRIADSKKVYQSGKVVKQFSH